MAFAPIFQRPFSATFDRRAAAAAAASWWLSGGIAAANAVAVYQPKGAASLAASYVNLANPGTYDAAPGVAPTFSAATGWTFASASNQYLLTGITATQTITVAMRFSGYSGTGAFFGCRGNDTPQSRFYIATAGGTSRSYNWGNAGQSNLLGIPSSGVICMAGNQPYLDGAADGSAFAVAWGGNPVHAIPIGSFVRITGVYDNFLTGSVQAVVFYNTVLTAGEVASVSAAMAAL